MKYIKTQEVFETYDSGDYVKTNYYINSCNKFKILEKSTYVKLFIDEKYKCLNVYGNECWLNKCDIKRKLTKQEIKNFEIKQSSIKYNI